MPIAQVDRGSYEMRWSAQEIVREVDHKPHLLLRITVRGEHFPHRAMVPVMRFVDDDRGAESWFAEITDEEDGITGYFPVDVSGDVLEYGYDEGGPLRRVRLGFDTEAVKRLDRERLGKITETTQKYLAAKLERRRDG